MNINIVIETAESLVVVIFSINIKIKNNKQIKLIFLTLFIILYIIYNI